MSQSAPLPVLVALDSSWKEDRLWLDRLKGKVRGFKVGPILFCQEGPRVVDAIRSQGFDVFLDLKLHDIPNTVGRAAKSCFEMGARWLSLHCSGGAEMLKAAAEHQGPQQSLLGISVLTSLNPSDLERLGIQGRLEEQVFRMAQLAQESKLHGLVCSPHEVASLKARFPSLFYVTPGIRERKLSDDQKRSASLREALEAGSNIAVVGRTLTSASNWEEVWQNLQSSMVAKS